MTDVTHMDALALEAGLEHILQAPADTGTVKMIVRRPVVDQREVLEHAELDAVVGLVGDNWLQKGSRKTEDGAAHPEMQLNLMNSRVIELVAGDKQNWPLAGDQLYVDFALTEDQLPPGTRLVIGSSIIEVTAEPHLGCKKFSARFGLEAMKFVNSTRGKKFHLRGINAKVIKSGSIRTGDKISRLEKP